MECKQYSASDHFLSNRAVNSIYAINWFWQHIIELKMIDRSRFSGKEIPSPHLIVWNWHEIFCNGENKIGLPYERLQYSRD